MIKNAKIYETKNVAKRKKHIKKQKFQVKIKMRKEEGIQRYINYSR